MEIEAVCRICLASEPCKDISYFESQQSDKTCSEIVLFCLGIQLDKDSTANRLCLKCLEKIISFYNFKLLALKNNAYFKNVVANMHIKSEPFLDEDLNNEEQSSCESNNDGISVCPEIKIEVVKNEDYLTDQSDDELLSNIKNIKYEFIPEDKRSSENVQIKKSKGKSKASVCKECGKSVINLKEHILRHERRKNVRSRLPCPWCDETFASYDSRSKHKLKTHLGIKKTCLLCNKAVLNLKSHTQYMHTPSMLRFECATCGKRFTRLSALKAHSSAHTKDRPHACDLCNKTFRSLGNMNDHKRKVHLKEKNLLCQFCSKSFSKKYCLMDHLRIHTKEKPYRCKKCGKAFSNTTTLRDHMFIHSDDKTFKCTVCEKVFQRPRYLANHMLTHTRLKRFPCSYCDMKFHRSDHVKQHHVAVHKTHLISARLKS